MSLNFKLFLATVWWRKDEQRKINRKKEIEIIVHRNFSSVAHTCLYTTRVCSHPILHFTFVVKKRNYM